MNRYKRYGSVLVGKLVEAEGIGENVDLTRDTRRYQQEEDIPCGWVGCFNKLCREAL